MCVVLAIVCAVWGWGCKKGWVVKIIPLELDRTPQPEIVLGTLELGRTGVLKGGARGGTGVSVLFMLTLNITLGLCGCLGGGSKARGGTRHTGAGAHRCACVMSLLCGRCHFAVDV
jgi:hypothetical protein